MKQEIDCKTLLFFFFFFLNCVKSRYMSPVIFGSNGVSEQIYIRFINYKIYLTISCFRNQLNQGKDNMRVNT